MIYPPLSLSIVGLIVGLLLVVLYGFSLANTEKVSGWMKSLPRSRGAGVVLLVIDAVWAFLLVRTMDLGEFSSYRTVLTVLVPVAFYLTLTYVDEFLAVRALGILLLLLAEPMLEAAFLQPQTSRLLLVVLAYAMIVKGIFFVGMPYLMRDGIQFALRHERRWRAGLWAGLAYGAILVLVSLTLFR
jgi:hypothetical protein